MYLNPVCRLQCGRNPALFTGMKGKIIALLLIFGNLSAQEVEVSSADALFQMALASNPAVRNAALQRDLAGITRKIAGVNAFSPRVPVSYQALDNIALQKTYVPGVIFGQPEGSYKELIMGQKYVATFNLSPQFDILNFSNRAQRRAAVVNEELAELSEKQAQRDIHLQINAAFHNVISFDRQKHILEENLEVARKIRAITGNRFEEGIARSQEVNEAEVNVVTLENSLVQLEENRRLQVELLKAISGSARKQIPGLLLSYGQKAAWKPTWPVPAPGWPGRMYGLPGSISGRCCRPYLLSTGKASITASSTARAAALFILPMWG